MQLVMQFECVAVGGGPAGRIVRPLGPIVMVHPVRHNSAAIRIFFMASGKGKPEAMNVQSVTSAQKF